MLRQKTAKKKHNKMISVSRSTKALIDAFKKRHNFKNQDAAMLDLLQFHSDPGARTARQPRERKQLVLSDSEDESEFEAKTNAWQ